MTLLQSCYSIDQPCTAINEYYTNRDQDEWLISTTFTCIDALRSWHKPPCMLGRHGVLGNTAVSALLQRSSKSESPAKLRVILSGA